MRSGPSSCLYLAPSADLFNSEQELGGLQPRRRVFSETQAVGNTHLSVHFPTTSLAGASSRTQAGVVAPPGELFSETNDNSVAILSSMARLAAC
jgi:hypothetical protein